MSVTKRLALVFSVLATGCLALDNGLGLTPALGWNSCDISHELIVAQADAIVTRGLAAAGYSFVNLDDCWQSPRRDAAGDLQPDPHRFPLGMAALGAEIRSRGLKFGIYSDAGFFTCQRYPGSLGHEAADAAQFAKWGVDYLKYDNCFHNGVANRERYEVMRDALSAVARPIYYSICEWGLYRPWEWAPAVGNSWRTTPDIVDSWEDVLRKADQNEPLWAAAGPGGWNDPDMLEIGNGGLSEDEERAHFALWAIMKAPLIVGCDVARAPNSSLAILTNEEVIAVNQDPMGAQGRRVAGGPPPAEPAAGLGRDGEVWAGALADGSVAVLLLNRGQAEAAVEAHWADVGLPDTATAAVRNLWERRDEGYAVGSVSAAVPAHGVVMFRITPVAVNTDIE